MATSSLVPLSALTRRARVREIPDRDPRALEAELRATVKGGEVRFDAGSRAMYAHDASNYRRIPTAVVLPSNADDVAATLAACRRCGVPVVGRGGGTALAGQTVNEAVVLDFSKHMNHVLAIDPDAKRAWVEPGVVCDDLVAAAAPFELTWGPKPATHDRCCFGGMLSNNCGGMHAQWNGIAVHNVEELDVILYDGTKLHLGWMDDAELDARIRRGAREGELLAALRTLRDRYDTQIRTGYPRLPRRVSGYNLDQLLPDERGRFNLARVIVGSEGTLATIVAAKLQLLDVPRCRAVVVLAYPDVFHAADTVPRFLDLAPLALEGIDDLLRKHIKKKGGDHARHLELLGDSGGGWLTIELAADTKAELHAKVDAALARAECVDHRVYFDTESQRSLADAREGALGATAFVPGEPDGWPGWEDSAVPAERLGAYLRDLRRLFDSYDYHPSLYGHFGMGVVHCRVPFDLYDAPGVNEFRRFMSDAADLVVSYGGSLSGEHGDGQARAELLVKMFGPELMTAMRELKAIFDPAGKMNPGKIVDPYPIIDHLKQYPPKGGADLDTHFRYAEDGGMFERSALRCVGIGRCRRKNGEGDHDVMCPSYMVTREEKHSTRGRAQLLFEMVRGDGPIADGWKSDAVKEALDLCLACKGCKGDCPVNVDIATAKAEFLSHYYEGRLRPRHAYAFGLIDRWARLAEIAPGLANLATQLPGVSAVAKAVAGVAQEATIPAFAPKTFRKEFAERPRRNAGMKKVVLFADTFNDHFHPDTLMAGVRVLEAAGYEVVVPRRRVCCGRPLYDFGMLDRARAHLEDLLSGMAPEIEAGLPVVVLEPSCASVLKDELPGLFPAREDAQKLRDRTMLLGELLATEAKDVELPRLDGARAVVQGHCHHKSILDFRSERAVLERLGLDFEVLDSGCCGMAGAFGFVSETRDVAKACGERVLLPRVRKERDDTLVIANGFSCREQIAQHTPRRGLHLAEVIGLAMDRHEPSGVPPELAIVKRREKLVRTSMLKTAAVLASVTLAAGAIIAFIRGRRFAS